MGTLNIQSFEKYQFFDSGTAAPTAVLLDDDPATIEQHLHFLAENRISFYVTPEPSVVKRLFRTYRNDAMYFFDMHMSGINKIRTRDTRRGVAVGFALICDMTHDGTRDRMFHCSTLTEFDTEPTTVNNIKAIEAAGQKITNIRKALEFDKFKEFVFAYQHDYTSKIKVRALRKNIEALSRKFVEIFPDQDISFIPEIFGYPGAEKEMWMQDNENVLLHYSAPDRERLEVIAYILEGLILFFDDDVKAMRKWLIRSREELNGASVWGLMRNGSSEGVFLAANFVNRVLG